MRDVVADLTAVDSLEDFILQTTQASSPKAAAQVLLDKLSSHGFSRSAYVLLTGPGLDMPSYAPVISKDYPSDWLLTYVSKGYEHSDPVARQIYFSRSPFAWSDLQNHRKLSRGQRRFLSASREAGLLSGMSVPLHGPMGELAALSVASEEPDLDLGAMSSVLHLMAVQFHQVYARLSERTPEVPQIQLSDRELEVLLWSARGKSNWEIGEILKISEHGVKFHMQNAMKKLNSNSRITAAVKAICLGLIHP